MTTYNAALPPDELPFVLEACGDTMWDEVLAQPAYDPALPPFTPETARQIQLIQDVPLSTDPGNG